MCRLLVIMRIIRLFILIFEVYAWALIGRLPERGCRQVAGGFGVGMAV